MSKTIPTANLLLVDELHPFVYRASNQLFIIRDGISEEGVIQTARAGSNLE